MSSLCGWCLTSMPGIFQVLGGGGSMPKTLRKQDSLDQGHSAGSSPPSRTRLLTNNSHFFTVGRRGCATSTVENSMLSVRYECFTSVAPSLVGATSLSVVNLKGGCYGILRIQSYPWRASILSCCLLLSFHHHGAVCLPRSYSRCSV